MKKLIEHLANLEGCFVRNDDLCIKEFESRNPSCGLSKAFRQAEPYRVGELAAKLLVANGTGKILPLKKFLRLVKEGRLTCKEAFFLQSFVHYT